MSKKQRKLKVKWEKREREGLEIYTL